MCARIISETNIAGYFIHLRGRNQIEKGGDHYEAHGLDWFYNSYW
jgi:hypothetical protein